MDEKLEAMREGGRKLALIKRRLVELSKRERRLSRLDEQVTVWMRAAGGEPSFRTVPGYRWATCITINDEVVHGIPRGSIKRGDLVTVDLGLKFKGYHTDTATSFVVGRSTQKQWEFLKVGRRALKVALGVILPGRRVGDISQAIQTTLLTGGVYPVKELTGHGVGRQLHEEPAIPGWVTGGREMRVVLTIGMTIAVEVIYTASETKLKISEDGWTMKTVDGSLSAVFEETVAVTKRGMEVLTN